MALCAGTAWQVWQAALSAQPSPGGQGDEPEVEQIRALVSSILSTVSLGHQKGPYAYAGEDFGRYLAEATRDCRTILRALSDLAARQPVASNQPSGNSGELDVDGARQPVGEPVGRVRTRVDGGFIAELLPGVADRVSNMAPLYLQPPAQAVDLEQQQDAARWRAIAPHLSVEWDEDEMLKRWTWIDFKGDALSVPTRSRESYASVEEAIDAVIDSLAVGNG